MKTIMGVHCGKVLMETDLKHLVPVLIEYSHTESTFAKDSEIQDLTEMRFHLYKLSIFLELTVHGRCAFKTSKFEIKRPGPQFKIIGSARQGSSLQPVQSALL